jgi:hypothetical protein
MEKRNTTTITLSVTAQKMLTLVALKQLRSRSHTIEALIREAYSKIREDQSASVNSAQENYIHEGAGQ